MHSRRKPVHRSMVLLAVAGGMLLNTSAFGVDSAPPPVEKEELGRWAGRWEDYHAVMWFHGGPGRSARSFDVLRQIGVTGSNVGFTRDHEAEAQNGFRFYVGDASQKGILYIRKDEAARAVERSKNNRTDYNSLVRPHCFNDPAVRQRLQDNVVRSVSMHKPARPLAYALGDEISIGKFASPIDWCYCPHCMAKMRLYLQDKYGALESLNSVWGTEFKDWNAVMPQTAEQQFRNNHWLIEQFIEAHKQQPKVWPVLDVRYGEVNLSQWNDHREFMDWSFAECLAELVEAAHEIDPDAPVGAVGLQMPSPWGGFDYARLSRALEWMEAYDIGENREINRSFCPRDYPIVQTHFIRQDQNELLTNIAEAWYYLLHGDRGVIIWSMGGAVQNNYTPTPGGESLGRAYNEFHRNNLALHLLAAEMHMDPIAIYYSQPSIRFNWFVDAAVNYDTWPNRSSSIDNSGYSSGVWSRRAFIDMLEDAGYQNRFISYLDVMDKGIPGDVRVLILPKTVALSDEEAAAFRKFVAQGGLLIADQQTGMLDEHLVGRGQSVLSGVFGIKRENSLLVEWYDAMAEKPNWDYGFREPPGVGKHLGFHVAEPGIRAEGARAGAEINGVPVLLEKDIGKGKAVYLNLCVENYNFHRVGRPRVAAALREVIEGLISEHGVRPSCKVFAGDREDVSVERLWYRRGDWWYLCLVTNASFRKGISGTTVGGIGGKPYRITVRFPEAYDIVNMRTGKTFSDGDSLSDVFVPFEGSVYAMKRKGGDAFTQAGAAVSGSEDSEQERPMTPGELNEWGLKQIKSARRYMAGGLVWRAVDTLKEVKAKVPQNQPAYSQAERMLSELGF